MRSLLWPFYCRQLESINPFVVPPSCRAPHPSDSLLDRGAPPVVQAQCCADSSLALAYGSTGVCVWVKESLAQPSSSRQADCFFWIQRFLDRWYGSDRDTIFPGRRVILTIPFEDTTAAAPRHTVGILTEALNYVGAEVVATVLAPGVHRRGEVSQRTDLMETAHRTGREALQD